MSRKNTIYVLLAMLSLIAGSMVYTIIIKNQQNKQIATLKQHLPDYQFYSLESILVKRNHKDTGIPVCIIYFNTECDHCQNQAEQIHTHIAKFKDAKLIMVSANTPKEIEAFGKQYQLNRHSQIHLLWDKESKFASWFGNALFPSVYIYNKKHNLVKEYHGEVKIETIINYLK